MPDWIIWAVGIWFFFNIVGRGRCAWGNWGPHRLGHSRRYTLGRPARSGTLVRPRARPEASDRGRARPRTKSPSPAPSARSRPKETPEERIRRRFVKGRTTLEEYEAELWEELRPK